MGPPPDGLTQTAVGQPLRPKNRTAEEEKRERQQDGLARARRLMAEARGMVEAVVAVGVKAVGEAGRCTPCREPLLAMAGRFAKRGGCGCDACGKAGGGGCEEVAVLRKCSLSEKEGAAMARVVQAGWASPTASQDAVEFLAEKLAEWMSDLCCFTLSKWMEGAHPHSWEMLEEAHGVTRHVWLLEFWDAMAEELLEAHGNEIAADLLRIQPFDVITAGKEERAIREEMAASDEDWPDGEELWEEYEEEGKLEESEEIDGGARVDTVSLLYAIAKMLTRVPSLTMLTLLWTVGASLSRK
eukprot:COSAG05_NODE_2866_length_2556_cov_6.348799_2_plen_299_part_00